MIEETPYVNQSAAADRLKLSASNLEKMRLSGKGPAYLKLGRRVVYAVKDLDAWAESKRCKSTSEYAAGA